MGQGWALMNGIRFDGGMNELSVGERTRQSCVDAKSSMTFLAVNGALNSH